jgi:osmotically-inducible protein OsmY
MIQKEEIAMKTDAELQRDVMDELKWEPIIRAAEIGVAVKDGVVTLSGSVDSYAKKWAADRAAKRVFGVKAVAEEIKVTLASSYKRADKDIAQSATKVLDWTLWVPSGRVKVMVQDGRITLSGDVDWYYQKERAEDAVRHLVGVVGVINSITIKPPVPTVKAFEVKNKIEDALKRNARLLLAAQKIQVECSGSKVILRGSVGSLAELEEAEWAAWAAPGVDEVDNKLTVTGQIKS